MQKEQKRVVAMVVARMGSTRVPGKSMIELSGHPVVWHVLQYAQKVRGVDAVCLVTSDTSQDDALQTIAEQSGFECYRGDSERVLDRLHGAAQATQADVILEIGGDCPLLDPNILSDALSYFFANPCDYLCNYSPPTFPEGMDVNVISRTALDKAWREAVAPSQRIHPFSYLTHHPELFVIRNFAIPTDLSHHHWSLDFPEDIELIRAIYEHLWEPGISFSLQNLLQLVESNPVIASLDKKLHRPKVLHAFWNSPGIVRDMHTDIAALANQALVEQNQNNYQAAEHNYRELIKIAQHLLAETNARQQ